MLNWLKKLITDAANRRKQHDEWAKNYDNSASGKNNLSLDPAKDPWKS